MNRDVTYWPAHPRKGSVKLKPKFVRDHHLGPVSAPQARARLDADAALSYFAATQSRAIRKGRAGE